MSKIFNESLLQKIFTFFVYDNFLPKNIVLNKFNIFQDWMVHINKCIKDLLEKGGKKPADEHAAVWVPDAAASTCMRCQKSQFNMINRRVRVCLFLLLL